MTAEPSAPSLPAFLADGKDMGRRILAFDWSATALGPIDSWSVALRTMVGMLLGSPQPMFIAWGPSHLNMLFNEAYRPLLGGKEPGALGQPLARLWSEVWPDIEPLVRRTLDGEGTWMQDMPLTVQRHGVPEKAWFTFSYNPIRDDDGRIAGLFCACSERTGAEAALQANESRRQASETRFLQLANLGPIIVWFGNPDGSLSFLNKRWYEYTGKTAEEVIPHGWIDVVHPKDVDALQVAWAQARATGELYEIEMRLRRFDGVYRWFLVRAVPLRDDSGTITAWLGSNTDIHERKMMETALRNERERIWTLSTDLMMVARLDGSIEALNPAWEQRLGYSLDYLMGLRFTDLVHPDDLLRTLAELDNQAQGLTSQHFENRYRHRDGGYIHLSWTAVPEGGYIHAIGRDITAERRSAEALRRTEEALRQSHKMEAVGQLTGGIAHDFNNLLQGITGSLDLILLRLRQGRTVELERLVTSAMGAATRAAALTHRLLAFSRRQPLDPRPVCLNGLVVSMEDLLVRTMGERISVRLALADDLWAILCDPNQLESALLNLAINARDAMPGGGQLSIETVNLELDANWAAQLGELAPGPYVCLCVSDTGTGMTPEVSRRAFEPFFTTKPLGQGTGLGLSMIYGFVRQSGGGAAIYSELGRGTTVRLYLPRYQGDGRPEGHVTEHRGVAVAEAREREVVLVVEDQDVVRGLVLELLEDLGYRTLEAADGPAGLAILESDQRIDLLLTDIGLPGLNGREMVEAIRPRRPELKVLFMTGYAGRAAPATGVVEHPMEQLVTKPFSLEALAQRIQEMLAS